MEPTIAPRLPSALVAAVSALLVAASAPVTAADNAKLHRQPPFGAGLMITEYVTPTPGTSCSAVGAISGWGLSTFGLVSLASQDCIVYHSATSFTFNNSSSVVLQTMGGDQIHAAYGGTATVQPDGKSLVLSGSYRLTGGTGAFRNASGCGTLHGSEDISTPPARGFVVLIEGACP